MNGRLGALWTELFDREITQIEAKLLVGVDRKVGSDSPVLILASLLVRMLYLTLIESKDSPFRVLASFNRTMAEHRKSVELISETYRILELNLAQWNGILARSERDILELRQFARAATMGEVLRGQEGDGKRAPGLVWRLLCLVWGGCFLSASAGSLIVMAVLA